MEQKIDNNEENLLNLFRLLTNYQIVQDELKVKIPIKRKRSKIFILF